MGGPIVVVGVFLAANLAHADASASFGWVRMPGASSCPSTQQIAERVEAISGGDVLVAAGAADLAIEGRVESRTDGGWHVVLSVARRDGSAIGERVWDAADGACGEILEPFVTAGWFPLSQEEPWMLISRGSFTALCNREE